MEINFQKHIKNIYSIIEQPIVEKDNFGADKDGIQKLSYCHFNVPNFDNEIEKNINTCFELYGKGILIIGDSHAIDLFGVIVSRFDNFPFIIGITQGGCLPYKGQYCNEKNIEKIVKNSFFGKVIYTHAGFYSLKKKDPSNKGRTSIYSPLPIVVPSTRAMFNTLSMDESVEDIVPNLDQINETLNYLHRLSAYVPVLWFFTSC